MKKILFIIPVILLFSCAKQDESVEQKKSKLSKLKSRYEEMGKQIETLEREIAQLDTTAGTGLKTRVVKIDTVAAGTFDHYIDVQGNVDSDDNIFVSPEMPGVITSIKVQEGDRVGKGTTLATLDASAMNASLNQVQAQYELAKTAFEKQERLWSQKIGSEIQYLQAKANKEALENQLQAIQAQINMSRLKSPISGTVDAVGVKLGEMAQPGMSGIRVVNLDKMKIQGKVGDKYVNRIKTGNPALVEVNGIDSLIETKISFVSQVINPQNRSLDVEIRLDNRKKIFKPNMIAKIRVKDETIENALVVPQNIIQRNENSQFVMVVENENGKNIARRREVKTGSEYDGNIVITEGLKPGDVVITFGYQEVVDGQPVSF